VEAEAAAATPVSEAVSWVAGSRKIAHFGERVVGLRTKQDTATAGRERRGFVVLIPARNEDATVGEVVRQVRTSLRTEVVVIDDLSEDATVATARDAGAVVLPLAARLGAWGAIQTGIRYALACGYEMAITMDADGQHGAEAIPALHEVVSSGEADVAIGAFLARGSRPRRLAWAFFRYLTGLGVEDLTSGFRAYGRRAMVTLATPDATLLEYQDLGVLLLLRANGMKITEVPVQMRDRVVGHSRVYSSWLTVGYYLLHTGVLCLSKTGRRLASPSSVAQD